MTLDTTRRFEFKKTWVDALGYCQSQGGHLATVNSPEEAEAIKKLMNENNIPYYAFIGFSDIVTIGDYITVEGQDIDHSGYTRWEGGLHSNVAWKCGAFTPAGELANRDCNEELPFICEKDIWSQWVQLPEQGSVYKLHREKLTWAEALEKCHSQQATLAVMNSDAEAEFVSKNVMETVKSVHVGIHDNVL
ncbi:hypothetical protein L9F63_027607 [Diploptera punctata]|uniref:C-type lectin domain-containing protein n=1 Tax=Diploptera punctata TaxID=6984 RepID=A0AAD8A638_DIPPU|nr:hypothetical protein L9F63_027607 [Diploptera punctata]